MSFSHNTGLLTARLLSKSKREALLSKLWNASAFCCGRRAEVASALDTCPLVLSPLAPAGDEIDLLQLLHLSSPRHNTREGCSLQQQLNSVISASNGAGGGEDRQGCQDHDGHPEGHGHPGLGPGGHPPDARVLLQVG